uniref:ATP synthase complex subunit 8 n=1 Tax=Triaenodes qinglingensis TaxID=2904906 RepID=A0A9E8LQQ5_9NEOP|nr:ATP synthase F0 subunit 8 [Triaenodes qinglingensis]UZZ44432.1 ATP synthase F0 subunit 8 [Triaenodes qinglingensis]
MPQMMPLNWIILYLLFLLIFIIFIMVIYYLYPSTAPTKNKMLHKTMLLIWKW